MATIKKTKKRTPPKKSAGIQAKAKSNKKQTGFGAAKKSGGAGYPKKKPGTSLSGYLIGTIDSSTKGYGFLSVEGMDEDIFIPANAMNGAMHGDTVKALKTSSKRGGGEGEVVAVLERGYKTIVCSFVDNGGYFYAESDERKFAGDIAIAKNAALNAKNKDKVVVQITSYDTFKGIEGKVIEVLGQPDEKNVDMLSIIRAHNLYETFPKSVLAEADRQPDSVLPDEWQGRTDFTDCASITIDGEDSRDFDDAVYIEKLDGFYRLYVHIADVTHYVKFNSKLDKEAFKRGTSVYFPDLVLPMLPKKLSNGICSLNENVERLVLSCIMDIDGAGNTLRHKIAEGVIKSKHRMTYNKVFKILEGDTELNKQYADIAPMLKNMEELSKILFKKRENRGAVEFDLTESQIILDDETGKVKEITKKPRLNSHRMIEEFMLAANETIAAHMFSLQSPFVYRSHEAPPSEKLETLNDFLSAVGAEHDLSEKPSPKEIAQLLKSAPENLAPVINRVALRSMSKATYEPVNNGHFGLAAEFYCHFTSPIRRYPDLCIHRIIKDYLHNGKSCFAKYEDFVAEASKVSSERERDAEKAEREVDDLKKAEFMSHKIGEKFEGTISGVTEWGFFVELENSCEGLVRTENLPGISYLYNPRTLSLSNGALTYRIGDKVKIIVESAAASRINFILDQDVQEFN